VLSKRLNVRLMIYSKWGMNDDEKNIYKLAETRKMKTRDLNGVKCMKDEDQVVLESVWPHDFVGENTRFSLKS
jgi:hypothetical protein